MVAASRGAEAFARARALRPAVVVLDLNLPDVSGLDVCRMVRGNVDLRATAVLILTARGAEEDRLLGFDAGADDYVVKPFHVRELVRMRVRALVQRVTLVPGFRVGRRPGASPSPGSSWTYPTSASWSTGSRWSFGRWSARSWPCFIPARAAS